DVNPVTIFLRNTGARDGCVSQTAAEGTSEVAQRTNAENPILRQLRDSRVTVQLAFDPFAELRTFEPGRQNLAPTQECSDRFCSTDGCVLDISKERHFAWLILVRLSSPRLGERLITGYRLKVGMYVSFANPIPLTPS